MQVLKQKKSNVLPIDEAATTADSVRIGRYIQPPGRVRRTIKVKLWKLVRNYLLAGIFIVWVVLFWPIFGFLLWSYLTH